MPGDLCSVAICKKSSQRAKKSGEKLVFFRFPKDTKIRNEWIQRCHQKDELNTDHKRICSKHFTASDYVDELKARLLNLQPKRLKKNAIPTLHLLSKEDRKASTARTERVLNKERKALVESLICSDFKPTLLAVDEVIDNVDISQIPSCTHKMDFDMLQRQFEVLQQEFESLAQENRLLKEKVANHLKIVDSLRKNIKDGDNFEERVKLAFKDVLTSNQVDIVLQKKTKARWTQNELATAFTLRYFSKRCYIYLRNTLHYPLPGLSTLEDWAASINLENGVLEDVLPITNIVGKRKRSRSRITVSSTKLGKRKRTQTMHQSNIKIKKIVT